jgi:hypothetical protein
VAKAAVDPESEAIRKRMAMIRREMHVDFLTTVKSAERALDWRVYVREYPWVAIGLAVWLGYRMVPLCCTRPVQVVEVPVSGDAAAGQEKVSPAKATTGLVGLGLGIIGPIAVRALQGYAIAAIDRWIAVQSESLSPRDGGRQPERGAEHEKSRTQRSNGPRPG